MQLNALISVTGDERALCSNEHSGRARSASLGASDDDGAPFSRSCSLVGCVWMWFCAIATVESHVCVVWRGGFVRDATRGDRECCEVCARRTPLSFAGIAVGVVVDDAIFSR